MPCKTFEYTTGKTIKKAIKTVSCPKESHIRQSIIKDAIGTDFTVTTKGQSRYSNSLKRPEITAKTIPIKNADKNPPLILKKENKTVDKKLLLKTNSESLFITLIGDANKKSALTIIAKSCHSISAKRTERNLYSNFLFIHQEEIIRREFSTDRLRILLKQNIQITGYGIFHFLALHTNDIALRKCFFGNLCLNNIIFFD